MDFIKLHFVMATPNKKLKIIALEKNEEIWMMDLLPEAVIISQTTQHKVTI